MPKTTSRASSSKRIDDAGSPSKQPRARKKKPIEVQDRSQWRSSDIFEETTINKTLAIKNYHLGRYDLQDVSYTTQKVVLKITGVDQPKPMYLYKERDVELIAWGKHGGPEGFEYFLNGKRAQWYKKHGSNSPDSFPQPASYIPPDDPVLQPQVTIMRRPKHLPGPETSTIALLEMKEKMHNKGQLWLWNKLNEAYLIDSASDGYIAGCHREHVITGALTILDRYDPRPTNPAPNSSSFNALVDVLERAVVNNGNRDQEALYVNEDPVDGVLHVDWKKSYYNEVYRGGALIELIQEHRLEGWKRARWLVYDKYANGIGSLRFDQDEGRSVFRDSYTWEDDADIWLFHEDRRFHAGVVPGGPRQEYYSLLKQLHVDH